MDGDGNNDAICDIGAFELEQPIPTPTISPTPTPTPTPTPSPTISPAPPPNPQFGGSFEGDVRFMRDNPAFPEEENFIDATDLTLSVPSDSSITGTFNADWLPNVAVTGGGAGNEVTFQALSAVYVQVRLVER
jgi:Predicted solute binding protein